MSKTETVNKHSLKVVNGNEVFNGSSFVGKFSRNEDNSIAFKPFPGYEKSVEQVIYWLEHDFLTASKNFKSVKEILRSPESEFEKKLNWDLLKVEIDTTIDDLIGELEDEGDKIHTADCTIYYGGELMAGVTLHPCTHCDIYIHPGSKFEAYQEELENYMQFDGFHEISDLAQEMDEYNDSLLEEVGE